MKHIILIVHNIRSTHNVGAMLRTAEGFGINEVVFTGYSPYPGSPFDTRLPHLSRKTDAQIHKTALGAENMISWKHMESIDACTTDLRRRKFIIAGLEQHAHSVSLPGFTTPEKIALIVGREVEGLEDHVLDQCDLILEIPMFGSKESFNVAQASAIALYHLRFN